MHSHVESEVGSLTVQNPQDIAIQYPSTTQRAQVSVTNPKLNNKVLVAALIHPGLAENALGKELFDGENAQPYMAVIKN